MIKMDQANMQIARLLMMISVIFVSFQYLCSTSQAITGCLWIGDNMSFKTDPSDVGLSEKWYDIDYDDSLWDKIDSGKTYQDQGYPDYLGICWYRKEFFVPVDWNGKTVNLELGFVSSGSKLYINGKYVSDVGAWNLSLAISSFLNPGENNLICIRYLAFSSIEGGLYRNPAQLSLMNPSLVIGLSRSVPVVNTETYITIYSDSASNGSVNITTPDQTTYTVNLDDNAQAVWEPVICGKYTIVYGLESRDVWVTANELMFHYWDESVLPAYATHVIGFGSEIQRASYWDRYGSNYTAYAYGYGHEGKTAQEIKEYWEETYGASRYNGITIDEIFISDDLVNRATSVAMSEAALLAYQEEGDEFVINPYSAGSEYNNCLYSFWNFRRAKTKVLWESYWGEPWLHKQRWMDMVYNKMDVLGGVLSISPGFVLNNMSGPLNIEQLRQEFIMIRTIAPEMRGLSFFNGYFRRDLDDACDGFIEDFFFKPLIHIRPKNGELEFRNIGNTSTPANITAVFTWYGISIGSIELPILNPGQSYLSGVVSNANRVELIVPESMENLYENSYQIPSFLNPLQVVGCSVENGQNIALGIDDNLEIKFTFNKDIASLDYSDIVLKDTNYSTYTPATANFDSATKLLTVVYQGLPNGYYGMVLESSTNAFRDNSNNPLDGSGDGLLKTNQQIDHYAVYFCLSRVENRIALSPVAHWDMNEISGEIAHDSQGRYPAQLVGEPLPVFTQAGRNYGAIKLNGKGQYLNAGNVMGENISHKMTVMAWIKVNSFCEIDQPIIGKGSDSWQIKRDADNNGLAFSINSFTNKVTNHRNVTDGNWHHIAAVYDGYYMKLYVDGVANSIGVDVAAIIQNDQALIIGSSHDMPVSAASFDGLVDEVAIYDEALNASTIRVLAAGIASVSYHWNFDKSSGDTVSDTIRNKICILAGEQVPTWNVADGVFGGSLKFAGKGYVDCGNITNFESNTEMTVTFWVKINDFTCSFQPIMGKGNSWRILRYGSTDQIMFDINNSQFSVISPVAVDDGQWHHVAAVYNGQSISLIVDGIEQTTNITSPMIQNDVRFIIGAIDGQLIRTDFFNGMIDELTVWTTALSGDQIGLLRSYLPCDGLIAYWPMDENQGITVHDYNEFLNGKIENITSVPWRYNSGVYQGAIELQGSGQRFELDNFNSDVLSTSMSLTMWLRVNQFTGGYQYVCGRGYSSWRILRYAATDYIMFDMNYSTYKAISPVNVNDGQWHYIALTFDGERIFFRVDDAVTITATNEPINLTSDKIIFGSVNNPGETHSFTGYFDEISYWSRALSSSEIIRAKYGVKHLISGKSADLNLDWQINNVDFAVFSSAWKSCVEENSSEEFLLSDINGDGFVEKEDLYEFSVQWLEF
jgi:hypothetical protein